MRKDIILQTLWAFSEGNTGGNRAGVVLDAELLSEDEMQELAALTGYSETAFVMPSTKADFRVRYFTPVREIPICGHATIALSQHLAGQRRIGETILLEMNQGVLQVSFVSGMPYLSFGAPTYRSLKSDTLVQVLGTDEKNVKAGEALVVDVGVPFLVVEITSIEALSQIAPDMEKITAFCDAGDIIGFYLFSRLPGRSERTAVARMFAPRFGIPEESATGTAAAALGAFLARNDITSTQYLIEQGSLMSPPSPSLIHVQNRFAESGALESIAVGGRVRYDEPRAISVGDWLP